MTQLKKITQSIEVPPSTGIDGFLLVIREILQQPRVQRIVMEATGVVSYIRLVAQNEAPQENLGVSFDHLEPYGVIRNAATRELTYPGHYGAAEVLLLMVDAVTAQGYTPICFASGTNTRLWNWLYCTSGTTLSDRKSVFGYPVQQDKQLPDTALVLCAGIGHTQALIDTKLAVKIEMVQNRVLSEEMEIL